MVKNIDKQIYKMIAKLSKDNKLSKKVTKNITKICKHAYCVGSQSNLRYFI